MIGRILVTAILAALTGAPWFLLAFVFTALGFESSEFQAPWGKWLIREMPALLMWIPFFAFTSASVLLIRNNRLVAAILVATVSLTAVAVTLKWIAA